MSRRLFVATRKGLFTIERNGGGSWAVTRAAFLGDNVSMMLSDPRDGSAYAALEHGHFGAKLHRSRDGGGTWEECAVPAYPPQPEGADEGVRQTEMLVGRPSVGTKADGKPSAAVSDCRCGSAKEEVPITDAPMISHRTSRRQQKFPGAEDDPPRARPVGWVERSEAHCPDAGR